MKKIPQLNAAMHAEELGSKLAMEARACDRFGQYHMRAFLDERSSEAMEISAQICRMEMLIIQLKERVQTPWWRRLLNRLAGL